MTAEVAVLNRSAIALAADSAVTISGEGSPKVYKTVNKLFTLSKYQPVGVMIYGNADYMSVPWETIIKLYRESLGKRELSKVADYASNFRSFVKNKIPVTEDDQKRRVRQIWSLFFDYLNRRVRRNLLEARQQNGALDDKRARTIFLETIKKELGNLARNDALRDYSSVKPGTLVQRYEAEFESSVKSNFLGRPFSDAVTRALKQCAEALITRADFRFSQSGVVIAGFGKDELFPSMYGSLWSGVIFDVLRSQEGLTSAITASENDRASLLSFAQGEMVYRFMEGVDPEYIQFLDGGIRNLVHSITNELILKYSSGDTTRKRQRAARVRTVVDKMIHDFSDRAEGFRYRYFSGKMLDIISILPKEELAELAGSLVEITSLKRRMSMDAESVGGPIDVAVISKGDGFVWIKRKHYFDPELNHFFMRRYLMSDETPTNGGTVNGT